MRDCIMNTCFVGISVLITMVLNSTDTVPLLDFDAAAVYEVILCLKMFIKSDGIASVSETRGAIDAICLSLDFNHSTLVIQVLELLSVITAYGGDDAIWQVSQGIQHLGRIRQEKSFACFAAAVIERDVDIRSAVLSFLNTYLMSIKDLEERITVRGHLYSAKFNQVLEFLTVVDGEESVTGFSNEMSAALLESIERPIQPIHKKSADLTDDAQCDYSTNLKQAYEKKYGHTRSVDAENRMLMGDGTAEDGSTRINPSVGIMAGYCYESKKHKEGVKRRWYCLKNNTFRWYHPEKKQKGLNGEKENGSISMADVTEILEYSTAGNLQNISRCGFVIKTNKAAPEDRYQIGVEDDLTKRRWITALRSSQNSVLSINAAFRMVKGALSSKERKSAADKLKKHINVFNLVENEDLSLIRDACSELSYFNSDDDWNDVASIVRYLCFEIISTGSQADLKDILQNIISLYDEYRQSHQKVSVGAHMSAKKYATISADSELKPRGGASNTAVIKARQTAQLAAAIAASKNASKAVGRVGASIVEEALPSFGRRRSISTLTYRLSNRISSVGNAVEVNASHETAVDLWTEDNALSKKEELRQRQEERKRALRQTNAEKVDDSVAAAIGLPVEDKSNTEGGGKSIESNVEPDGKAALMAMIAARGPRLPPPPRCENSVEPSSSERDDDSNSGGSGKNALMAMIAARGPRLPPPPQASTSASQTKAPAPFGLPRCAPTGPSEAELKKKAEEEAEEAKYPPMPEYHPARKMRSLFWTKLKPSEAASTVWSSVQSNDLDWTELEKLFCDEKAVLAKPKPQPVESKIVSSSATTDVTPTKPTAVKQKLKNVALFDGKRTQNVSIGIKKLRMSPPEIVDTIIKMDPSKLTKEVTNTLLLLAPTATETAVIQGYGGDQDELDLVGQLFYEMLRVPRVAQRLEIMKSTHEWIPGYNQLLGEVNTLSESVQELKADSTVLPLKEVLAAVLSAGNYLNAGSSRSRAHGVKLDILIKLANLKQNGNPKGTLLHFIVDKSRTRADTSTFYSAWSAVWNAPRIHSRQLESDIRALAGDINIMKTERNRLVADTSGAITPEVRDPLISRINTFLAESEQKLSSLQDKCKNVLTSVSEVRAYFGDTKGVADGEDPCSSFFGLIVTFSEMYARALADINVWAEEVLFCVDF